jgi:tetratricopeptide (TPR) repeat protein
LYITGRVVVDDGTPPPQSVTIERVCSSSVRAQGYTDQKGRFSFQLGQTGGVMQDASETGAGFPGLQQSGAGMGGGGSPVSAPRMNADAQLSNCDLRAVLAGYSSTNVMLSGQRVMDNPDIGTIVLHRLANVNGSVVSMTSLEAPREAQREFEKGRQTVQKNRLPEAALHFQKAVDIFPKFAAAWYELGRVQERTHNFQAAHDSFQHALAADSKFMSPYIPLAELAAAAKNWRELADITGRLISLDPVDYPAAYLHNAVANLNLQNTDAAEKSAREGERLDTAHRYPLIEEMLARALIRKRDYPSAAEHLRAYLLLAPAAEDAAWARQELAELERKAGGSQQAEAKPAAASPSDAHSPPR